MVDGLFLPHCHPAADRPGFLSVSKALLAGPKAARLYRSAFSQAVAAGR
jgi:hypothetical protein